MRIAFVTANYAPSVGGAQEHVRRVAEGLAGRGHEVRVLTTDTLRPPGSPDPGHVALRREVLGGVGVERFGVATRVHTAHRYLRRVDRRLRPNAVRGDEGRVHPLVAGPVALRLAAAVRRAYRTSDVVVGCPSPFLTMVAPPRLRGSGRAASVAMPLLHLRAGGTHPWVSRALRRCDGITASTTDERHALLALGVPPERIALLPPGTDPGAFPELAAGEARRRLGLPERPTVGYVGRLAAHKGIDTLVAAAPLLWKHRPDTTVLVAGSPTSWLGFADLVARAGPVAGDRLVVREGFPDHDRALLLAASDVIACPSREESYGMVTVEAWAARRPVVACDVPAVRCVVHDGVDGALVPVDDPPALAAALAGLLADPGEARARGLAGRARVERELAWPRIVADWEGFLVDVAGRRSAVLAAGGRS